jgi:hypothetical protein
MDSHAKRGNLPGQLDGPQCSGHIGHNRGAGQYALRVCLNHGSIYAVAQAEVVCVYYDFSFHLEFSLDSHDKARGEGQ